MARDFNADMELFILEQWPPGDFVSASFANDLVQELRKSDPKLLTGWLEANAVAILTDLITRKSRMQRGHRAASRASSAFGKAADEFEETGDAEHLSVFSTVFAIDEENTRRPLADMTGPDHEYVADRYEQSANISKLKAAFHRAVAKELGNRKTSDVYTEEQYHAMLRSILEPDKATV